MRPTSLLRREADGGRVVGRIGGVEERRARLEVHHRAAGIDKLEHPLCANTPPAHVIAQTIAEQHGIAFTRQLNTNAVQLSERSCLFQEGGVVVRRLDNDDVVEANLYAWNKIIFVSHVVG